MFEFTFTLPVGPVTVPEVSARIVGNTYRNILAAQVVSNTCKLPE